MSNFLVGIASNEKSYSCSYCFKKFARDICAKEHKKFHMGKEPHSCGYCEKKCNKEEHKEDPKEDPKEKLNENPEEISKENPK